MIYKDQAATPFGALAWSYHRSRVSDPPSIIDAFTLIVGRVPLRKTGKHTAHDDACGVSFNGC
ncbi:MAG: hypothetical protein II445_09175 [Muribaculaceae bacterium]|nr:hypothetical protein [Muribaculaceae bacterium]